jgi:succinylglutamate desuccinylase
VVGLIRLEHVPDGLLEVGAEALHGLLPSPTLIHLQGRQQPPLFVSILLHGNETTGLAAVQALLRKYAQHPLPRSLSVFIGNVAAARLGLRRLNDQPDFNRIWPGHEQPPCAETVMAQAVFDDMARRGVFASIDVHNNTGINPHYVCLDRLDDQNMQSIKQET